MAIKIAGDTVIDDSKNWLGNPIPSLGSGGATVTGSVTLTSSSDGMQSVTTTAYGQSVTLPDATTLSEGVSVFAIANRGSFPLLIKNNSGTLLGYVPIASYVQCSLADKSTSAGVWDLFGETPYGPDAGGTITFGTGNSVVNRVVAVTLDANRVVLLAGGPSALQAIVYDSSTQTFGSSALVRTANVENRFTAVKSDTDRVLVVSCQESNGMQAVVLSFSGSTITVNSATSKSLTGNCSQVGDGSVNGANIVQIGSSFIVSYNDSTNNESRLMAITISGTTPTFGNESTPIGTKASSLVIVFDVDGTVCLAFSTNGSTIYVTPYTVSGSTMTVGSYTLFTSNVEQYLVTTIGSRWAVLYADTASYNELRGAIISVSGTTATHSIVTLGSIAASYRLTIKVNGSNAVCYADNNSNFAVVNVLTDSSGTATAGTEILLSTALGIIGPYGYASDGIYCTLPAATDRFTSFKLGNSGAQPTATALNTYGYSSLAIPVINTLGSNMSTGVTVLLSGQNSYRITNLTTVFDSLAGYLVPSVYQWQDVNTNSTAVASTTENQKWVCRNAKGTPSDRVYTFIRYTAV